MSTGTKHDGGKLPWHLLPWDAAGQVVAVLRFGAQKYADRNWEGGIAYSRLFSATQRHLTNWFQGRQDADPETGLSPLAHAACDVLFLLAFTLRDRKDLDDRPGFAVANLPEEPLGRRIVDVEPMPTNEAKTYQICAGCGHPFDLICDLCDGEDE